MKRFNYDLSCFNAVTGQIGRLQTIFNLPVIANDTISIQLVGALRLARLKRFLTLDCKVDLFAFFVPHRHIYDNFVTKVRNGIKATVTLSSTDLSGGGVYTVHPDYLGAVPNSTCPDHYHKGYEHIWFNYFYPMTLEDTGYSPPASYPYALDNSRKYGRVCARLPNFWCTGVLDSRADSTADAEVSASGGAGAINLLDLRRVQSEYKDALQMDWFTDRYRDQLQGKWGTTKIVNIDADERPELLMHSSTWLSGYDVDGTDSAELGNWRGKAQGMVNMQMPPKYFREHGMIWVMAVLRFPSILQEEKHYTTTNTLTYDVFMGDPSSILSQPPIQLDQDDFTGNGISTSMGTHPYGQWYRTQNNRIHTDFHGLEGMPFETIDNIANLDEAVLYDWDDPSDFFMNEDLGQWNMVSKAIIDAKRVIPPATASIKTGVNLI